MSKFIFTEFDGVEAIAETALALLVVVDGEEYWIPKATISDESEVQKEGDIGELVMSESMATEKGMV